MVEGEVSQNINHYIGGSGVTFLPLPSQEDFQEIDSEAILDYNLLGYEIVTMLVLTRFYPGII